MKRTFDDNIAMTLSYTTYVQKASEVGVSRSPAMDRVVHRLVRRQLVRMPGYLKPVFKICALLLSISSYLVIRKSFCRGAQEERLKVVGFVKKMPSPLNEYVSFFETFASMCLFEEKYRGIE